ncbi:S46 family peptidase [Saccharicrinis aurantiacus]|uniref:S46 family peptidase n=1 Tax=Saccharicrinis aurantiacus TaxID=1849719 RepID=UPI00249371D8|nr:S46 family peptidase [Saccharicrinis aurantiacus]
MKQIVAILCAAFLISGSIKAAEGMWIPILLQKYNIEEMQELGFKLTAEDIYSVNQASMKDAVVIFGSGCTGELISNEGLLITNHHCGYSAIQSHSSLENDYLTNGFWAMNRDEELTNPGLKATFLRSMKDVTEAVLEGVTEEMTEKERNSVISKNSKAIKDEAIKDTHFTAVLKPFFHGNQYFLFVNEVFTDVRLVGAPPSAIGKFGGDTDNWMWPRHTGDFSLFRIYANEDNEPAEYAEENKPYTPKHHFPISMKGVSEGDFTMVFGYPGSTYEYVPSYHIKMITEKVNPTLIDVRTKKLEIMNRYQGADPAVRIKYAAKNASTSNSWKRWIGEIKGLDKLNAIEKKEEQEVAFQKWADASGNDKYKTVLTEYKGIYEEYSKYYITYSYISEMIRRNGMEGVGLSGYFDGLISEIEKDTVDNEVVLSKKEGIITRYQKFFKDYYMPLDKEETAMLLQVYQENIDANFLPDVYMLINGKYNGDISKYVDMVFEKSVFMNQNTAEAFVNNFSKKSIKKLHKDPAYILLDSFVELAKSNVVDQYKELRSKIMLLDRTYMAGLMEFENDKVFYPDANFTLRVSYGQVSAYEPKDAVQFKYYTTLEGIIEKDNPDIYDYRVPAKLKELHTTKDFGKYEVNGTVPVCFVATNHTTGGNSGSPVVNANGELIGINFDRAWEGVMSDLMYNPEQCRNISLDVRYVLFLIDKFAGASYLLNEMTIIE